MKIVITGALGHIGSKVIRELPSAFPNAEIVLVDNLLVQRYCSLFNLPSQGNYRFLEGDVLINVPVIKHHGSAQVTISMKNLMGAIWDRRFYHKAGLHDCIAEFCLFRKPDLNIVDGYRVTLRNGPQRARPEDVVTKKMLIVSADCVAADTAAAKIQGADPAKVGHITRAAELKIGRNDLSALSIERITV